jgi:hypothetical protein
MPASESVEDTTENVKVFGSKLIQVGNEFPLTNVAV